VNGTGRRTRAAALIAASAVVILAAGILYLQAGPSLTSPFTIALAPNAAPSHRSSPVVLERPCETNEMKLTGILQDCASVTAGMSCPKGSFNQVRVVRLHGATDDFILYIEVNGGYLGPNTYPLQPWPDGTLGNPDGMAKVAVRQWTGGALWQSTAGSLNIDETEEAGWVDSRLERKSASSGEDVVLNIAGRWSCS